MHIVAWDLLSWNSTNSTAGCGRKIERFNREQESLSGLSALSNS